MRQGTGLLPASLSDSPISARLWLAMAAGVGSGVCAFAGLYPQFDNGSLRGVIALTSVPFAAGVVAYGLGARTAAVAFGKTLFAAAVLGMASTVIPAVILTWKNPNELVPAAFFGAFFGAATGVVYGIPLGILSAAGHRHVHVHTHEGTDRASRVGGIWLFVLAAIGIAATAVFDHGDWNALTESMTPPSPAPALAGSAAALGGALVVLVASLRLRRRHAWLSRVRAGLEPAFRIRPAELRDGIDGLPRLGNGICVIEARVDALLDPTAGSAYRSPAAGTAVAIVDDDMCTMSTLTVAPAAMSVSATSG
jgi:hypothetical protein